jgi:hypothetical protein
MMKEDVQALINVLHEECRRQGREHTLSVSELGMFGGQTIEIDGILDMAELARAILSGQTTGQQHTISR